MKHILKDYKVKMYTPRESANQNVVTVGERNDEDQAMTELGPTDFGPYLVRPDRVRPRPS